MLMRLELQGVIEAALMRDGLKDDCVRDQLAIAKSIP